MIAPSKGGLIAAERAALDALSSDPNPEDKGRVENNLGIALLSLAERGRPEGARRGSSGAALCRGRLSA